MTPDKRATLLKALVIVLATIALAEALIPPEIWLAAIGLK